MIKGHGGTQLTYQHAEGTGSGAELASCEPRFLFCL